MYSELTKRSENKDTLIKFLISRYIRSLLGCIVFDFFSKSRWLVIKSGTCMKKQRVQNFSEIGGAFEVPPGGGKNSSFGKKGAIFKVSVCNENKNIFNLARSKIAVL